MTVRGDESHATGGLVARLLPGLDAHERHAILLAMLWVGALLAASGGVDAISQNHEAARLGLERHWARPWISEYSSRLVILLMFPAVAWATVTWDLAARRLPQILGFVAAGSAVFSLVHVAGMVGLRKLLWPMVIGAPYEFGPANTSVWQEFIYKFRKDVLTFLILIGVTLVSMALLRQRRELEEMRQTARETRKVTLKCGSARLHIPASDIVWVKAAGNYVEVRAGERTHLVRSSLKAIAEQVAEAGGRLRRVHRSWAVDPERIRAERPSGQGDLTLALDTGEEIPASRTYYAS